MIDFSASHSSQLAQITRHCTVRTYVCVYDPESKIRRVRVEVVCACVSSSHLQFFHASEEAERQRNRQTDTETDRWTDLMAEL